MQLVLSNRPVNGYRVVMLFVSRSGICSVPGLLTVVVRVVGSRLSVNRVKGELSYRIPSNVWFRRVD